MEKTSQDIIKQIRAVFARRKHLIIIPFTIFAPLFSTFVIFLPKTYYASTTILVERQKIPVDYVKPTVTSSVEDRLRTITQQMMSPTRLRMVLDSLGLIPEKSQKSQVSSMVSNIQKNIQIEVGGKESFKIAFTGGDPSIVMKITNQIASLFIEENLKLSEQQAQSTTEFLSSELSNVELQLKEHEVKLREYKQKYMGELPDQLDTNLRTLDRLQTQLQTTRGHLKDTRNQVILLEQQISGEKKNLADEAGPVPVSERDALAVAQRDIKRRLLDAQSRYSEDWPEVKRLKEKLADIEAQLKNKQSVEPGEDKEKPEVTSPVLNTLKINLRSVNWRIKSLIQQEKKLLEEIDDYKKRVDNTPKREEELISLTRDNDILRNTYRSLLDKKLDAKLSESLERKQKGENFIILDPAELPLTPHSPKFIHIVLAGLGGGLAMCLLFVYVSELLDHSFYDLEEVEVALGFPLIGVIPQFHTKYARRKKLLRQLLASSLIIVYLGAVGAVVVNRNYFRKRLVDWGVISKSRLI